MSIGGVIGGHDYGQPSMVVGKNQRMGCVPAAVSYVLNGHFVHGGEHGDWWIVVTPELKEIVVTP